MIYTSVVRTVVPLIVAVLIGQAARVGLDLDEGAVTSIVTTVVGALYYAGARWIEERWPAVGRWLLSAGLATGTNPTYTKPPGR
ncbi:hypothetical protein [Spirillospora sp. CA-294931]|uniref:hypothetical protein n=1 Tax=Spirillospora sp. CA-294931 TaxID=3240042 RepID=UPI003D919650